jgi:uncharacterized protein
MKTNPLARHGGISYLEIPARDPERSAAFYQHVVGWQIDRRAADDFRFAHADGSFIGRFTSDAPRDGGLVPVIYVDDVAAAVARVSEHGGEVTSPPRQEGDVLVARVRDPAGNALGLWQFA